MARKLFGQMLRDAGITDEDAIDEIEQAVLSENKRYRESNRRLKDEIQELKDELEASDGGVKLKDGEVVIPKADQTELEQWRGLGTFAEVKERAEGYVSLKDENDTFKNASLFAEAAGDKYDENALKRFLPKGGLSKVTVKDNGKDVTGFQVKDGDTTLSLDEWVKQQKSGDLNMVNFAKSTGSDDDDGLETEPVEPEETGSRTPVHTGGRTSTKGSRTKDARKKSWGSAADETYGTREKPK